MATHSPLLLGAASALALPPFPAVAQTTEELMAIIQKQQRQIEELSQKVEALEAQSTAGVAAAEPAVVTETVVTETIVADTVVAATAKGIPADTATAEAEGEQVEGGVVVRWEPGPTIASADGDWSFHIGGRLLADAGVLNDDDGFYRGDNATQIDDARISLEGTFRDGFYFNFETDFANDEIAIKDAYLQYAGEPLAPGRMRLGQFRTYNSLEFLTADTHTTFMEPGALVTAFGLNYQLGAGVGTGGESWGVDAGAFGQNTDDQDANEGYAFAGRAHAGIDGLASDAVLHLGASVRYRNFNNDVFNDAVTYAQKPFFNFATRNSVDTGAIRGAESDTFAGTELAWIQGPLIVQAEAANTWTEVANGPTPDRLWGAYGGVSYVLTGEHRDYDAAKGAFGRMNVDNPLGSGGLGAWEIAARLDYIDLNSGIARGGEQYSAIAGVNWYLTDWSRLMLDGAWTHVYDAAGTGAAATGTDNDIYGVGARAQVEW